MKTPRQFRFALAAGLTLALVPSAQAALTPAGDTISNLATVDYEVGGIPQDQEESNGGTPVEFLVDRKINLTVDEVSSAATQVVPGTNIAAGPTNKAVTFTVKNDSNDVIDIALSATQQSGGLAPFGGLTDNFTTGALTIYLEDGTTVGYQQDEDTVAVTYLDEVDPADPAVTVHVVGSIALTREDGDVAVIILTGTAYMDVNATTGAYEPSVGSRATATAKAQGDADALVADDVARIDTVLGDLAGIGSDAIEDGNHSDRDQFNVVTAKLVVSKSVTVVSDPFSASNPKAIPGATLEYCIAVENTGNATADNVTVDDDLGTQPVTLVGGSIEVASDATTNDCTTGTFAAGGSFAADTVSATQLALPAGDFFSVKFQVTVD